MVCAQVNILQTVLSGAAVICTPGLGAPSQFYDLLAGHDGTVEHTNADTAPSL